MAKGAIAKKDITDQILKTFEGSFIDGKDIRIPFMEDGDYVEIKVALTCAKTNLRDAAGAPSSSATQTVVEDTPAEITPPTQEELDNVANLIAELNL